MKNITTKQYIISSILVLIIAIIAYYVSTSKPTYIEGYKKTIDSAQVKIDSLNTQLVKTEEVIDSLKIEIKVLDKENETLKDKIVDIKKENHEKINAVDKLNNAELGKFFSNRYDVN